MDTLTDDTPSFSCIVGPEGQGDRIDSFLARKFTYFSRNGWQKRIDEGIIAVNMKKIKPSTRLACGDRIHYLATYQEPDVDKNYSIIFEDDDLLVVNKPGNIPVHACGRYLKNTLVEVVRQDMKKRGDEAWKKLSLLHRLDRETSGVILLVKNKTYVRDFYFQFFNNQVEKEYLAIVHGVPGRDFFVNDRPIYEHAPTRVKGKCTIDEKGQPSRTEFEVVQRFDEYSLVRAYPKTGRTNQIRVHLYDLGYPIVGDKLYRDSEDDFITFKDHGMSDDLMSRFILPRQALHAHSIKVHYARTGEQECFTAPLPDDMKTFLESL